MEVFILIHQPPQFEAAVEPDATEINLIYHNWLFKNEDMTGEENLQEIIDVGLFQPFNVSETKQNTCGGDTELLDGIPFGRLGPRVVELVSVCLVFISLRTYVFMCTYMHIL